MTKTPCGNNPTIYSTVGEYNLKKNDHDYWLKICWHEKIATSYFHFLHIYTLVLEPLSKRFG
jgi:hypothetical protein